MLALVALLCGPIFGTRPADATGVTAACTAARSAPALTGSFIDPNWERWWTADDVDNIAGRLCAVGITDVVLQQTADTDRSVINYPTGAPAFADFSYERSDAVGNWLAALARRPGMHLYLGLGLSSSSWWSAPGRAATFADYLDRKVATDLALATDITGLYGARAGFGAVFAGWYLPDEIDDEAVVTPGTSWVNPQATTLARSFLGPVTAALHRLTPGKTVFLSPFYEADTTTPAGWTALWTTLLDGAVAASGPAGALDAIAPQDGLGHGGGSATAPQLDTWFRALAAGIRNSSAAAVTRVWDNVETYRADGRQHYATTRDMVNAMRSAATSTHIDKYLSFSYAEDQTQHPALDAGYTLYVRGTPDPTPPPTPTGWAVHATGLRSAVRLTWSPSVDKGGSTLYAYRVFRDGLIVAELDDASRTVSFLDRNLDAGRHTWQIAAVDGAGNQSRRTSTVSAVVAAATAQGPDRALHARYFFPGSRPGPYADRCTAATRAAACAGQLTNGHEFGRGPLPTAYPAMFAGEDSVAGTITVVVDLGTPRAVHEVTSQWLSYTSMGVWLPSAVTVAVSTEGATWRTLGSAGPPSRPVNAGIWPNYVAPSARNFAAQYSVQHSASRVRFIRVTGVNPYGTNDLTMLHSVAAS